MSVARIIENLKKYVDDEIKMYNTYGKSHGASVEKMVDRCYGAVMYSSYLLSSNDDSEIADWWDNEMLPLLRKMEFGA